MRTRLPEISIVRRVRTAFCAPGTHAKVVEPPKPRRFWRWKCTMASCRRLHHEAMPSDVIGRFIGKSQLPLPFESRSIFRNSSANGKSQPKRGRGAMKAAKERVCYTTTFGPKLAKTPTAFEGVKSWLAPILELLGKSSQKDQPMGNQSACERSAV